MDVTVVVLTRDRRTETLHTLDRLAALPERPPVVLVDNASSDGTAEAVRERHPEIDIVVLTDNRGAAGRTAGVERARTPYVAFADDDSWWAPGALTRAEQLFDRHARLALLAARVLVGDEDADDPICAAMAASPLPREADLPGPSVLGFLACGAVVRRAAYLAVGGFDPALFVYGEETLLALDLAAAGWGLSYLDAIVAHHHPSPSRGTPGVRQALERRNALLTAWRRRPARQVARLTATAAREAVHDRVARRGLAGALRAAPAALTDRHRAPVAVEQALRRLEADASPRR